MNIQHESLFDTAKVEKLYTEKDGVEVIEANVQADHVHIILSIPPKYACAPSKHVGPIDLIH